MESTGLQPTVAIKACDTCEAGLLETDKFCRWCGVRQPGRRVTGPSREATGPRQSAVAYETTRLASRNLYHPVSGPLMDAVVRNVGERAFSGFTRRLVLALISVPIWMMIVLLSPLDAYASAKILAGRM